MIITFTGIRNATLTLDLAQILHDNVESYINKGCVEFRNGLCYGSDWFFVRSLHKHKEKYPHIKIVGYVPHKDQSKLWSSTQKEEYKQIVEKCDEIVIVSNEEYTSYCMHLRNLRMLDGADYLLSIYDFGGKKSGTLNTIKEAEKMNSIKEILIVKI